MMEEDLALYIWYLGTFKFYFNNSLMITGVKNFFKRKVTDLNYLL